MIKKVAEADSNAIIEEDGAIKWKSNGRYLMDDYCEVLEHAGYNFSRKATEIKRDKQVAKEIEEYRKNYTGPSAEELAEMRAEFGRGQVIVNVLTGTKIRL